MALNTKINLPNPLVFVHSWLSWLNPRIDNIMLYLNSTKQCSPNQTSSKYKLTACGNYVEMFKYFYNQKYIWRQTLNKIKSSHNSDAWAQTWSKCFSISMRCICIGEKTPGIANVCIKMNDFEKLNRPFSTFPSQNFKTSTFLHFSFWEGFFEPALTSPSLLCLQINLILPSPSLSATLPSEERCPAMQWSHTLLTLWFLLLAILPNKSKSIWANLPDFSAAIVTEVDQPDGLANVQQLKDKIKDFTSNSTASVSILILKVNQTTQLKQLWHYDTKKYSVKFCDLQEIF